MTACTCYNKAEHQRCHCHPHKEHEGPHVNSCCSLPAPPCVCVCICCRHTGAHWRHSQRGYEAPHWFNPIASKLLEIHFWLLHGVLSQPGLMVLRRSGAGFSKCVYASVNLHTGRHSGRVRTCACSVCERVTWSGKELLERVKDWRSCERGRWEMESRAIEWERVVEELRGNGREERRVSKIVWWEGWRGRYCRDGEG